MASGSLMGWLGLAALVLCVGMGCACEKTAVYYIAPGPICVVVAPQHDVDAEFRRREGLRVEHRQKILGFYSPADRTIWVRWLDGKPDMETLTHELMHSAGWHHPW